MKLFVLSSSESQLQNGCSFSRIRLNDRDEQKKMTHTRRWKERKTARNSLNTCEEHTAAITEMDKTWGKMSSRRTSHIFAITFFLLFFQFIVLLKPVTWIFACLLGKKIEIKFVLKPTVYCNCSCIFLCNHQVTQTVIWNGFFDKNKRPKTFRMNVMKQQSSKIQSRMAVLLRVVSYLVFF